MRRAAPTAGLSPQLIKHFAVATVSVTALLALFATDADWGAQAQLEATQEKNRLAAAEAEKLGAAKVVAKLKVRRRSTLSMGDDVGVENPGGGGSLYPEPPAQSSPGGYGVNARRTRGGPPGAPQVRPTTPANESPEARKPSQDEIDALIEASRQRSGSTSSDD